LLDCQTIIIAALFGRKNYRTFAERECLDHHSGVALAVERPPDTP